MKLGRSMRVYERVADGRLTPEQGAEILMRQRSRERWRRMRRWIRVLARFVA